MAVRAKWSADYTKGLGARLNGAQSLETGRDIVPAQRSLVERRLHVGMDLEHDRELMRQGNDRRTSGLASQALLPDRVHGAAANAAVLGRGLLDRGLAPWTGADLEWSDLLETVSDHQCVLQTIAVPAETVLPWRVIDYARRLRRVKYPLRLSTLFDRRRISGGKILAAVNADEVV
jgi:hypothetical protein